MRYFLNHIYIVLNLDRLVKVFAKVSDKGIVRLSYLFT